MSYTKGPWILESVKTQSGICHKIGPFPPPRGDDSKGKRHACLYADYPSSFNPADQELEANARLIAAAPELLEALIDIADDYSERFDMDSPSTNPGMKQVVAAARAAIAKAKGEVK